MIELRDVVVKNGSNAIGPVSFRIESQQHAVLEGPTGAGKTTLIEAIAGLRQLQSGEIWLRSQNVTRHRPKDRRVAYVPQDTALIDCQSVRTNLSFGLRVQRVPRSVIHERVAAIAHPLHLSALLDRDCMNLSGGERQRVALGRAMVLRSDILLFDEPLASLDDAMRIQIQSLIRSFHKEVGCTILHVTHNRDDATSLGDAFLRLEP